MQLPLERGPISRHIIDALRRPDDEVRPVAVPTTGVLHDEDGQLALWILYELHYRGFDDVSDDREWDPGLIGLRGVLERGFERELRDAVRARLAPVVASATSPSSSSR